MSNETQAMNHPTPLQAEGVCYAYEEARRAVDHVDLALERGSFVAVLGHNGSGKSTLAKLMNALFLPTEGRVLVCGMDTAQTEQVWEIRRHAGMVFQNPDNQIVATVVREDVAFGLENLGVPQPEMGPRIDAALHAVKMTEFAGSAPHMLSGGQKQRVAIAGALAMDPDVMILDEATAMLDPRGREEVLSTVHRLNRDLGMTVIMITQYMEETVDCDRVFVMSGGKLALCGTPEAVFSDAGRLDEYGLAAPAFIGMREKLQAAGMPIAGNPMNCTEMCEAICQLLLNN